MVHLYEAKLAGVEKYIVKQMIALFMQQMKINL